MKAVFLDYATIGAASLSPTPLYDALPDIEFFDRTTPAEVEHRIRHAEFVLTNKVRLDASNMADAKDLRYIGLAATGSDNVDLEYCRRRGIAVCNIRGYCTQSVVEHVFGMMLGLCHNLKGYNRAVRRGDWQKSDQFCLLDQPIRELSGMTLGIVGYGELGKAVARVAELFGMEVLVARRRGARPVAGDGRVDFDKLLSIADIITLHCPLTEDTRNMMGAAEFRAMKRDSILINTARGALVDSAALVAALEVGEIGAAAIDVLPEEPPARGNPLLDYRDDNLVVTPHIAWATSKARQNAINDLASNVDSFLRGRRRNRIV